MAKRYGRKKTSKRRPTGYKKGRGRKGKGKKTSGAKRAINSIISSIVKDTEPFDYVTNFAYRSKGTIGACLYSILCQYYDAFDISYMHNTLQPIIGSVNAVINRFVVGRFNAKYCIKSVNNMDTWMTIYKCVPRRDVNIAEVPFSYLYGNTTIQIADPFPLMQTGYKDATYPAQNVTIQRNTWPPGVTPYMIPAFCAMFKIIGRKQVKITGGGYKFLNVKSKPWHLFNGQFIWGCGPVSGGAGAATDRQLSMLAGKTVTYFAISKGQPVPDATDGNKVSIASPDYVVDCSESYEYTGNCFTSRRIQMPITTYDTVTNMSTITEQTEEKAGYVFA